MCKLLIVPYVSKNAPMLKRIIKASATLLTVDDKDGYGYAALGDNGMHGERWINPAIAFKAEKFSAEEKALLTDMADVLSTDIRSNSFGEISASPKAAICHARYATCGISLTNTHPFVNADNTTAIAHNGIIASPSIMKTSTCDSESLLHLFETFKLAKYPDNVQAQADTIRGSYTYGVMHCTDNVWYVDVVVGPSTILYMGYSNTIGAPIFCTSDSILRALNKTLSLKIHTISRVNDTALIRFNVVDKKLCTIKAFDAKVAYTTIAPTLSQDQSIVTDITEAPPIGLSRWHNAAGAPEEKGLDVLDYIDDNDLYRDRFNY